MYTPEEQPAAEIPQGESQAGHLVERSLGGDAHEQRVVEGIAPGKPDRCEHVERDREHPFAARRELQAAGHDDRHRREENQKALPGRGLVGDGAESAKAAR
jgi:hypothetical protein